VKKILFLFAISMFIFENTQAQQAWTKPKGKFFTQVGLTIDNYDGIIPDGGGKTLVLNRKIQKNTIDAYLEYGISDKLTITGVVPFITINSKNALANGLPDGSLNAFSNIQLATTYRFYRKKGLVVSGKVNIATPTASFDESKGLRTGDAAMALEPSLLFGYGHSKFFTSAEIGFGFRSNNYSSQSLLNAQIGKSFGKKQKMMIILNTVNRVSNKDGAFKDQNNQYTALFLNNMSFTIIGLKTGYKVTPKMTLWVNIRSSAPWGTPENIGEPTNPLPAFTFSFSYQN
jgi:hypothetical protein